MGLPITGYMKGLDTPVIMAKNELSFIKFVIKPLWECMATFSHGGANVAVENVNTNLQKWEEYLKKHEAEANN